MFLWRQGREKGIDLELFKVKRTAEFNRYLLVGTCVSSYKTRYRQLAKRHMLFVCGGSSLLLASRVTYQT